MQHVQLRLEPPCGGCHPSKIVCTQQHRDPSYREFRKVKSFTAHYEFISEIVEGGEGGLGGVYASIIMHIEDVDIF